MQCEIQRSKKTFQSIRDYAMIMVQKHSQNPANIYPFIQAVEQVIYGGRQPSNKYIVKPLNILEKSLKKSLENLYRQYNTTFFRESHILDSIICKNSNTTQYNSLRIDVSWQTSVK